MHAPAPMRAGPPRSWIINHHPNRVWYSRGGCLTRRSVGRPRARVFGMPPENRADLGFAAMRERRWDDDLLALIKASGHLCLQVDDPGWEDARGYLFNESTMTLYFPVAKKYLNRPLSHYEVLIWGRPQVLVRGELQAATSEEDTATQLALARAAGLDE